MRRTAQTLILATFSLLLAAPVFAGPRHGDGYPAWQAWGDSPRHDIRHEIRDNLRRNQITDRLERQHNRIRHGVENGSLTHKEKRKLAKQQRRIKHLTRDFLADGRMSRKEHRILTDKLDRASKRIWRLKHNDQNRYCDLDQPDDHGRPHHDRWSHRS